MSARDAETSEEKAMVRAAAMGDFERMIGLLQQDVDPNVKIVCLKDARQEGSSVLLM